jgi:hypothetical protein
MKFLFLSLLNTVFGFNLLHSRNNDYCLQADGQFDLTTQGCHDFSRDRVFLLSGDASSKQRTCWTENKDGFKICAPGEKTWVEFYLVGEKGDTAYFSSRGYNMIYTDKWEVGRFPETTFLNSNTGSFPNSPKTTPTF